jgi:hypothetical protein
MKSELCFQFNKRKHVRAIIFWMGLSVWIIYSNVILEEELNSLNKFISIVAFSMPVHTIWSYFQRRNASALIITKKQLICNVDSLIIELDEIEELEYKIKSASSYLLVKLKNNKKYLESQKWYKVPSLYFNMLLDKAPIKINLEWLQGDAKDNFDKISIFLIRTNNVEDENGQV